MITITISKTTTKEFTAIENFVTKETPTDKVKQKDYGNGTEIAFAREFATRDVLKSDSKTVLLFEQRIEDDSAFDLAAVIVAINKLGA